MVKTTIILMAAALHLSQLATGSLIHAQERTSPPVTFHKAAEGVYEVRGGGGANGGCIITGGKVMMIDAKSDERSMQAVLAQVKDLTEAPIAYVVNTHSDGDHVSGNSYYPPDAVFVAHENCRAEMLLPGRSGTPSLWNDPDLAEWFPEVTFRDRMTIHLGGTVVELWHFGSAHTTGDTVVYLPENKIAFIADQIFTGRPQLIHANKGGNSFGHVKNLTRMLETLDADIFYNGHGAPVDRTAIENHIASMKARHDKVETLMGRQLSLEDILREFDDDEGRLVEVIYNERLKMK